MSEPDPDDAPDGAAGEPFIGRWSRLKARSRASEAQGGPGSTGSAPAAAEAGGPRPGETGAAPAAPPLPDLETLGEDSDYSAFLSPEIDAALRKRALRKLFHSPKFNVFDGLDTYRDDFTSFPALGSVVTADMRHQLERAARELAARAADAVKSGTPATAAPSEPPASEGPAEAPVAPLPNPPKDDDAEPGPA